MSRTRLVRKFTLAIGCAATLLLTACGPAAAPAAMETPVVEINVVTPTPDSGPAATLAAPPSGTTAPAPTLTPSPDVPVRNAAAVRDVLLAVSQGDPWDQEKDPTDIRQFPAWAKRFPGLGLSGYLIVADPLHVSVYRNVLNAKNEPGANNPKVLAFTVADTTGGCAAGALKGFPTFNSFTAVDIGAAKCMAQSVVDILRK